MIPVDDAEHYYYKRHRSALAMAEATADCAARCSHLEMARQYAKLAGEEAGAAISVSVPFAERGREQLVVSVSTAMKPPRKAVPGKLFLRAPPKQRADCT